MFADPILMISCVGLVSSLFLILAIILGSREDRAAERLEDVSSRGLTKSHDHAAASSFRSSLPKIGAVLMPEDESKLHGVKNRLLHAGFYRRHSTAIFLGTKFLLMVTPMLVGIGLSGLGLLTVSEGVLMGAFVGLVGNVAPTVWLRRLKRNRQKSIRRALPDALDVIVVCLEGGLSLPGAFAKVSTELKSAHPLLSDEMAIVGREVQLGRSTGGALRQFADRFDLEELRSLASVVIQAERFGASVVKALRVHAESLRVRRYQHAEAMAQKAPVKLIFPTVLCIFPALYIVLMGPAGVQLLKMLDDF